MNKQYKTKFMISLVGFMLAAPFLMCLLLVGAFFYYFGKISKLDDWRDYGLHISYGVDQLGNTLLMGKPAQTISTRVHLALKSGRPRIGVVLLGRFIDFTAKLIAGEENHIENSDKDVLGNQELLTWIKKED